LLVIFRASLHVPHSTLFQSPRSPLDMVLANLLALAHFLCTCQLDHCFLALHFCIFAGKCGAVARGLAVGQPQTVLLIGGFSPDLLFCHRNALFCLDELALALPKHVPGRIQLLLCHRDCGKGAARAGIGNRYQLYHLLPFLRRGHQLPPKARNRATL
jgi:hypothetical protein